MEMICLQTLDSLCSFETLSAVIVDTEIVLGLVLNWFRSFAAVVLSLLMTDLTKVLVFECILEVWTK